MKHKASPDPWLYGAAFAATFFGILAIWDAGYATAAADGRLFPGQLKGHLVGVAAGLVACFLFAAQTPSRIRKLAPWILILTVAALGAVLVVGKEVKGAQRWIEIAGVSIQPAEFAKLATILFLAATLAKFKPWTKPKVKDKFDWLDKVFIPKLARSWPLLVVGVIMLLIEMEPDAETAIIVGLIMFGIFIYSGVSFSSLVMLAVGGMVLMTVMVFKEDHRSDRLSNHAARWSVENIESRGYQATLSETAFASGGLFGVGIGQGRAKHTLPEPINDFILATIGEELGLVGSMATLLILATLAWRLFYHGLRRTDRFESIFLVGMAGWIALQTCVNMLVATGAFPVMGCPLPFFSAGGSSMMALLAGIGMSQAIIRAPQLRVETAKSEGSAPENTNRRAYVR